MVSNQITTTEAEIESKRIERRPTSRSKKIAGRPRLPKKAIGAIKIWLESNKEDPYPTTEQKKFISRRTGLSVRQIENWMMNYRARQLRRHD